MELIDYASIQRRLHKLGFNPGPVDGVRGRHTVNAIQAFQASAGLVSDGIVGPATFRALFGTLANGEVPIFDRMPWFQEAFRLVGLKEAPGVDNNPEILKLANHIDLDYKSDDIPWCGLFVAFCIGSALPKEATPNYPLRARAWEKFGMDVPPEVGALMVFWRISKSSGKGHVGFYFSEDDDSYHILGGNQSDMVNVTRLKKDRFITARWPLTSMPPAGLKSTASVAGAGPLSENEA